MITLTPLAHLDTPAIVRPCRTLYSMVCLWTSSNVPPCLERKSPMPHPSEGGAKIAQLSLSAFRVSPWEVQFKTGKRMKRTSGYIQDRSPESSTRRYRQLWQTKGTEAPFCWLALASFPGEVRTNISSVPDLSTTSLLCFARAWIKPATAPMPTP